MILYKKKQFTVVCPRYRSKNSQGFKLPNDLYSPLSFLIIFSLEEREKKKKKINVSNHHAASNVAQDRSSFKRLE